MELYLKKIAHFLNKKFNDIYLKRFCLLEDNNIFTHMTTNEKIAIHRAVKKIYNPAICLEIGSYLGASACFICNALGPDSKLICIDTWQNDAMKYDENDIDSEKRNTYSEFKINTQQYHSKIIALRGWSTDVVNEVTTVTKTISFLFIDGDHNYEGVLNDWNYYSPLLKSGSLVAFHDTGWAEGVKLVISNHIKEKASIIKRLPNLEIYKIR